MARLIRDVMTPDVDVISPDDTLLFAAQKMRDLDVGPLPVCDGERLQGMLTDRDIVVRGIANGRPPDTTRVADVMSAGIESCFEDEDAEEVLERMEEKQVRRFVVLSQDKRLVGIVSLGDLAGEVSQEKVGQTLQGVSEPARH